jgi:hypothetical protein
MTKKRTNVVSATTYLFERIPCASAFRGIAGLEVLLFKKVSKVCNC